MPSYDFRCKECKHRFTLLYPSIDAMEADDTQACPACGATQLSQLIRQINVVSTEEQRMERLADPSRFAGLDEEDPKALGRFMREMSGEMGEDLGEEFDEVVDRLESGESPDSIEQSLGDDLPDL